MQKVYTVYVPFTLLFSLKNVSWDVFHVRSSSSFCLFILQLHGACVHCVYIMWFGHPGFFGYLGNFQCFAVIINTVAVNKLVYMYFCTGGLKFCVEDKVLKVGFLG